MDGIILNLIRHAHSATQAVNDERERLGRDPFYYSRQSDALLSEKGEKQAKALGTYLYQQGKEFASAYSSTAVRAVLTCKHALKSQYFREYDKDIELFSDLEEIFIGDVDGHIHSEVFSRYPHTLSDQWNHSFTNGESYHDVADRVKNRIDSLVAKHKDGDEIVLFSHAGPICFFTAKYVFGDYATYYQRPVNNTAITTILAKEGSYTPVSFNQTPHLDLCKNA
jgi:broad specificity phosphatase PhoE